MKEIANKMQGLIKINVNEKGDKLVSARELYLGLGLNKSEWSRWRVRNIENNDFFNENEDWVGFVITPNRGGKSEKDYAISLKFAKHIAMMARTEKSHVYRDYFIQCEKQANEIPRVSIMDLLKLQEKALDEQKQELVKVKEDVKDLRENTPLYNVECDDLQKILRRKGTSLLGGKGSNAYNDKSLRQRVYIDIQREIKRQFNVGSYKAIKRKHLDIAKEIIKVYKLPYSLQNEVDFLNESEFTTDDMEGMDNVVWR